jgi:sporulation protein YlmC with PRC-barrel domain
MRIFDLFRSNRSGIVIPWDRVRMIGEDVILVELDPQFLRRYERV